MSHYGTNDDHGMTSRKTRPDNGNIIKQHPDVSAFRPNPMFHNTLFFQADTDMKPPLVINSAGVSGKEDEKSLRFSTRSLGGCQIRQLGGWLVNEEIQLSNGPFRNLVDMMTFKKMCE